MRADDAAAVSTFTSLVAALRAGWMVYDRADDGYLTKQFFAIGGWKVGRIILRGEAR